MLLMPSSFSAFELGFVKSIRSEVAYLKSVEILKSRFRDYFSKYSVFCFQNDGQISLIYLMKISCYEEMLLTIILQNDWFKPVVPFVAEKPAQKKTTLHGTFEGRLL